MLHKGFPHLPAPPLLSSLRWRCVGAVVASPSVHCLDTSVGQIVRHGGPPSGTAFVDSSLYRMLHYSPVSGFSWFILRQGGVAEAQRLMGLRKEASDDCLYITDKTYVSSCNEWYFSTRRRNEWCFYSFQKRRCNDGVDLNDNEAITTA